VEWLAEERTQVVGTFPPKKKGWTGLVEKDTAGQTNIYSVEVPNPYCLWSCFFPRHLKETDGLLCFP
jgi:hypothetical protein